MPFREPDDALRCRVFILQFLLSKQHVAFLKYFSIVLTRILTTLLVATTWWNAAHAQRSYTATTYEYIFSMNQTTAADSIEVDPVLRFSGWMNYGFQFHHDFGKAVGFYTGLQLRNVGMITRLDTLRLKHRAYTLGIPLALKIGNTEKKWYIAPGAEAELMFNYKVKEFIRGKKVFKHNEWFSDDVNLFNPSVFLQVNLGGAANLKFKYYLMDFLKPVGENESYRAHVKGSQPIPGYTRESKLFYISFGTTIAANRKNKGGKKTGEPQLRWPGQRKRDV